MKRLLILTIGFCLLLSSVPVMADQAEDEAAIRKVVEQVYAALNKHDAKAMGALYVDDFENWSGSIKGRVAWEKNLSELFENSKDSQWKQLEEIAIIFVTPDVAIYKDRHELSGWVDADGQQLPPLKRLWGGMFAKKNGKWLIAGQFIRRIEE